MGNGKCEMGNVKCEMGNVKWEMGNVKWEMLNIVVVLGLYSVEVKDRDKDEGGEACGEASVARLLFFCFQGKAHSPFSMCQDQAFRKGLLLLCCSFCHANQRTV